MLKDFPDDIKRHINSFLLVMECLNLEVSIQQRMHEKVYYMGRLYKEDYRCEYKTHKNKICIETLRVGKALYSTVYVRDKLRQFVILHKEDISTRSANRKAFEVIKDKESTMLIRRLEMIGF
mgnify:CR=1 FL=1|tara:strand:+ start:936 stop:1301 length:366 start_codon:yes stop_codon:yes gene_type:complete